MTEHGTVVEIKGDRTVVQMDQGPQCGSCRACIPVGSARMHLEVDTVPGISVGSRVEVEIPVSRMRAIVTVFVLPLAAVLLGAILGKFLTGIYMPDTQYPNLLSIVLALAFVLLAYLGIYIHERAAASRRPRLVIRKSD